MDKEKDWRNLTGQERVERDLEFVLPATITDQQKLADKYQMPLDCKRPTLWLDILNAKT